jgi:probable HAF family extracellular repeat protein
LFSTSAPSQDYELIRIEDLGGNRSQAWDINRRGQVVGRSATATWGGNHAFLWEKGEVTDLHPTGGENQAFGINDLGQVVGVVGVSSGYHVALWDQGVMTDLGGFEGFYLTEAWDINNRGQIVGHGYESRDDPNASFAFIWEDGEFTDLGNLGGAGARATAINIRGQVVGYDPGVGAFLWENGEMIPLPDVWQAWDINDRGQVVGSGAGGAVMWEKGVLTPLGVNGVAHAINNLGQVVGSGWFDGELHAFLWEKGVMTDLGAMPGEISQAWGISESGLVVGWGQGAGTNYAVLWAPKN